MSSSTHWCA
jgi:hypothetical protein